MKRVVVLVVLAMVVIGSCAAQSASNDAQRIVGTWTKESGYYGNDGDVWVFNANGTGTRGSSNFVYGISVGGKIYIKGLETSFSDSDNSLYMSPDGKRMIFNDMVFVKK